MLVPGCMWQTMHWLVGIARVNECFKGWPERLLRESSGRDVA